MRTPRQFACITALYPPTDGDRQRVRNVRREARAYAREIEAEWREAVMEAFRVEIGVAVRSAFPLLMAMLEIEG